MNRYSLRHACIQNDLTQKRVRYNPLLKIGKCHYFFSVSIISLFIVDV